MNRILSALAGPIKTLLRWPLKLVAAPGKFCGLSLPTRIALVVGLVTVVILVVAFIALNKPDNEKITVFAVFIAILIGITIPFAVRWAAILWLEGPTSQFPEIDKAWNAGLRALAEQNLDPANIPIYLVHGIPDEQQATYLFQASQGRFTVDGAPLGGVAELHWYASPEAVFLVCMGQSQLSAMTTAMPAVSQEQQPRRNMRDTLCGTIEAMELQDMTGTPPPSDGDEGTAKGADVFRGTLTPELDSGGDSTASSAVAVVPRRIDGPEKEAKLEYVCQLLRRLRQPACPINGILTVLPLELVHDRSVDQAQVQEAMRGDLETIRKKLQLRCPAVTLITGMESEVGFRELVRRVGHEKVKHFVRFGKGFRVWNTPSPEQLEAVAAHACVAFDGMAYKLFRETDGLMKPGNPKLYSLICRVRTEYRERLESILVGAYSHGTSPADATDGEPLLFNGCYFASTGERSDLQAFVHGVFHLLHKNQDELQWTESARREDAFYQRLAHFGFAMDGALLIGIAVYLIFQLS